MTERKPPVNTTPIEDAHVAADYAQSRTLEKPSYLLFWGCFIALITTSFGFVGRLFLIGEWSELYGLDPAQAGRLVGIGIWPFAVSIILFSLIIDRIGYKVAMYFAFLGHLSWVGMAAAAYYAPDKQTSFQYLYWGSLILGLANGTIEAFINPVVATMFSHNKTKWLNILHAGWPGGLVLCGILVIFLNDLEWIYKVGLIAIPTLIYGIMLTPLKFPVNERVASGVTYRQMLQEFGILGAAVVSLLLTLQVFDFMKLFESFNANDPTTKNIFIGVGIALVVAFGLYTQRLGRPLLFFLILIMMPLATTEIGTDGWITSIMDEVAKTNNFHPGWVLVYTSAIMLVLRFFAGAIVHKISPLGLLTVSCLLAIGGLYYLSFAEGMMIFAAATLYGVGKTFFWPTMLGVTAEQCPRGGAFTLNAISGIGMLAVGTLGSAYIGKLQVQNENIAVASSQELNELVPGLVKQDGNLTITEPRSVYEVIKYDGISEELLNAKIEKIPAEEQPKAQQLIAEVRKNSVQTTLADMIYFPLTMLAGYILLILYFAARGGYKAQHIGDDHTFNEHVVEPQPVTAS